VDDAGEEGKAELLVVDDERVGTERREVQEMTGRKARRSYL
jgi:hypothetical protein